MNTIYALVLTLISYTFIRVDFNIHFGDPEIWEEELFNKDESSVIGFLIRFSFFFLIVFFISLLF